MKKIKNYIKENGLYILCSFIAPIVVMIIAYYMVGVYPNGPRTILTSDASSQYANFHASFNNVLHGKQNIFYTWYGSLGLNYWSLISYYLGGIFTPLVYFFKNESMADFLYYLTLLKIGTIGISFFIYGEQTYKLKKWQMFILSFFYAQMSFLVVFAEIIMWMDAFIYLPMIILGINRLMDKNKVILLYVSYLLLFLSNFYMSFMVGCFSVLYFIARLSTNKKVYIKKIASYLITSFLAGIGSMIIVLPMLLDIRNNGEILDPIVSFKTDATGIFDLVIKNMVGVYDSTKYGSTPYLYIGLFPLILGIWYFFSTKINKKNKLAYGSLIFILILSFYIEPLNLFWHGFHAPNMFLFRFSFLFSFVIIMLAGYSWEKLSSSDFDKFINIFLVSFGLVILVSSLKGKLGYSYLSSKSIISTIGCLVLYFFISYLLLKKEKQSSIAVRILLIIIVFFEISSSSISLINSVAKEWGYPKNDKSESYQNIKKLVDNAEKRNKNFYRLENLSQFSVNDSFGFGYSGVGMFSSIRNRHSSEYLNDLGFYSPGTNLLTRYENNTLLMDSILGLKYIIDKNDPMKYGFTKIDSSGEYNLYENKDALPLGILTDDQIFEIGAVETQIDLFNHFSKMSESLFTINPIRVVDSKNVKMTKSGNDVTYQALDLSKPIEIEWDVEVPAHTQSYVSMFPVQYEKTCDAMVAFEVGENTHVTEYRKSGQYFNIGYYQEATKVRVKVYFYLYPRGDKKDLDSISFIEPDVASMDITKYEAALNKIKDNGIDFNVEGRQAIANINSEEDQVVFTTIPYDKGWKAYIDGERVEIPTFKDAFLAIPVPKGKHTLKLVFLPQGIIVGSILFIISILLFSYYAWNLTKQSKRGKGW